MEIHPLAIVTFLLYGLAFALSLVYLRRDRSRTTNPSKI